MWDFMKKPRPPRPVCQMQPTHEAIKQLEAYRRYVLESLDCFYKQILKELSVTDPESIKKLESVLSEYKELEASMNERLNTMQEMIIGFKEARAKLVEHYNEETEELTLSVKVE